jgi:hypothetical protein
MLQQNYKNKYLKYKTKYLELKQNGGIGNNKEIVEDDIMYKDDLVCILKPHIKKGIIIWSNYTQPSNMGSLYTLGLKTGKKLKEEGVDFGRSKIHPYIFFRAPYLSADIDYSTIETEIISSFGQELIDDDKPKVFIRVDPDKTFVFSSEIRVVFYNEADSKILNSKKTLSKYLTIIKKNLEIERNPQPEHKILYNLLSIEAKSFPNTYNLPRLFSNEPINKNSEILVSIPHLTPDYFVLCRK